MPRITTIPCNRLGINRRYCIASLVLLLCVFTNFIAHAQDAAARYEINAKRGSLLPTDRDALPRGREFVRLDSTYYPGWMFQGLFLQDRSADRAGYQRALPYIRTAFVLIEKDFTPALKSLYNSIGQYMQHASVYVDYINIARALRECYEYLDMPDSAMWVLDCVEDKQFKRDDFGLYGSRAWIIHRNRFYTDGRYSFLKNTVAENEKIALQACYDGFTNIKKNERQNSQWFGPYITEADRHYLYHYLAMIHSYIQQYDSSEYYYTLMANMGSISWNNYGSLKHETGYIESAIQLYGFDKIGYNPDKRLMEPYYYLPLLSVYGAKTTEAIETAQEAISIAQSAPGFGWYNIALARGYLYNGQLDSADIVLQKAANFKEIHIGTTLTQPQYEFTISLLRLVWYTKKIALIKFSDKGWWYKPAKLYELITLVAKRYADRYVLATLLAENPERDRIIYDLFCGESTVTFDEIFNIMQSFSPAYFSRLMMDKYDTDPRENIKKYFQLGRAYMHYSKGDLTKAGNLIDGLIHTTQVDTAHEKLFLARLWELKAACSDGPTKQDALNSMFSIYPELVPFSGQPIHMSLQVSSEAEDAAGEILAQLRKSAVVWVNPEGENVPAASIYIEPKGNKYEITIDTRDAYNKPVVRSEKFLTRSPDKAGTEILLRVFGKKGDLEPG